MHSKPSGPPFHTFETKVLGLEGGPPFPHLRDECSRFSGRRTLAAGEGADLDSPHGQPFEPALPVLRTNRAAARFAIRSMKTSFEEIAKAIWRQALVENEPVVTLGGERYPVTRSRAKKLRQVVFEFDGESFIGIEQNPKTKSRWAAMARAGKKVMQFIQDGRYIAVVADGKVMLYGKRGG